MQHNIASFQEQISRLFLQHPYNLQQLCPRHVYKSTRLSKGTYSYLKYKVNSQRAELRLKDTDSKNKEYILNKLHTEPAGHVHKSTRLSKGTYSYLKYKVTSQRTELGLKDADSKN